MCGFSLSSRLQSSERALSSLSHRSYNNYARSLRRCAFPLNLNDIIIYIYYTVMWFSSAADNRKREHGRRLRRWRSVVGAPRYAIISYIYCNIPNVNIILRRFSMPIFFYTPASSIYQIFIIHIDDRGGEIGEIIFYSISATFKYHFVVCITSCHVTSHITLNKNWSKQSVYVREENIVDDNNRRNGGILYDHIVIIP